MAGAKVIGLIDCVVEVPDLPICRLETVLANESNWKFQPAVTAVWSNDCSIGVMFTEDVVLNVPPRTPLATHMRSVLITIGEDEVAKLVTVPAWFV